MVIGAPLCVQFFSRARAERPAVLVRQLVATAQRVASPFRKVVDALEASLASVSRPQPTGPASVEIRLHTAKRRQIGDRISAINAADTVGTARFSRPTVPRPYTGHRESFTR